MYHNKEDGHAFDYTSTATLRSSYKVNMNPFPAMADDLLTGGRRSFGLAPECYSRSNNPFHSCIQYSAPSVFPGSSAGYDLGFANQPHSVGDRMPFPHDAFFGDPNEFLTPGMYSLSPRHAAEKDSSRCFFPCSNMLSSHALHCTQTNEEEYPPLTSLPPQHPPNRSSPCPHNQPTCISTSSSIQSSHSEASAKPEKKRRRRRKKPSGNDNPDAIVAKAFDREGCRKLQTELEKKGVTMVASILSAMGEKLSRLLVHPYGNYLFQKLVETATSEQRRLIVQRTASSVPTASNTLQGTRCVQCLIKNEHDGDMLKMIVEAVAPHAKVLCCNKNGNHVVQLLLDASPKEILAPLYEQLLDCSYDIARNCYGCSVIIKCIDSLPPSFRVRLLALLQQHMISLIADPYGNYAVQHIMKESSTEELTSFCTCILGNVVELAVQKSASNVVELAMQLANDALRNQIIDELLNSPLLPQVLFNEYGSFVIQIALTECDDSTKDAFYRRLSPYFAQLSAVPNGYYVISKLQHGTHPS
ncbi:hypothetical protein WA556_004430 [Blastocystis sp. ATCC 50177/Nand II]